MMLANSGRCKLKMPIVEQYEQKQPSKHKATIAMIAATKKCSSASHSLAAAIK